MHRAGGESKLHPHGLELAQQPEVDGLLQVHVHVEGRVFDDIDHLVVERTGAKRLEMRAVKTQLRLGFDELAHHTRNGLSLLGGGTIGHAKREHDAPPLQHAKVADGLLEQVGVGHHDLLALQAADACGLETNHLHRARHIAHYDEVAHLKRLVHRDGERGKQVSQDVLHRQRHRNAAHAQAGDEGRDVHTHIRQDGQQHHAPQQRAQPPGHQRGRGTDLRHATGRVPLHIAAHANANGTHAPQAHLQRHSHKPQLAQAALPAAGQVQQARAHEQSHHQHQCAAGAFQHIHHGQRHAAVRLRGPHLGAAGQQVQHHKDGCIGGRGGCQGHAQAPQRHAGKGGLLDPGHKGGWLHAGALLFVVQ